MSAETHLSTAIAPVVAAATAPVLQQCRTLSAALTAMEFEQQQRDRGEP